MLDYQERLSRSRRRTAMCTMITEQAGIVGSGKGTPGWIKVDRVNVSYDHPAHMTIEHTLNIDFVDRSGIARRPGGGRVDARVGPTAGRPDRRRPGARSAEVDGPEPAAGGLVAGRMDVRIREAVPEDAGPMAKVHIDTWRTAYAGIVPSEHLAGLSYERREAVWVQILYEGPAGPMQLRGRDGRGRDRRLCRWRARARGRQHLQGSSSTPYTCSRSTSAGELDAA